MEYRNLFIGLILPVLLLSCKSNNNTLRIVKEWQGRQVLIPVTVTFKVMGKDTLCPDILQKPYKILTYIDSTGCIGCQLDLFQWKRLIDSCKVHYPSVSFCFVIHSTDYSYLTKAVLESDFNYPIIYDRQNEFDKLNHFPLNPLRTFLLNEENEIEIIGSPITNPKIWNLYRQIIEEGK